MIEVKSIFLSGNRNRESHPLISQFLYNHMGSIRGFTNEIKYQLAILEAQSVERRASGREVMGSILTC